MVIEKLKSLARATPLYSIRFARQSALRNMRRTPEDNARRELYSRFVSAGDLVFDIGANVGDHTKLFLDLGCNVVAVEPQRNCVAALRRSFNNRVNIVRCAVSDRDGVATMQKHDTLHPMATLSNEWLSRLENANQWTRRERVQTTTFDHLIETYGTPKFAKIDVEGSELSVLTGLSSHIDGLCFEYAREMINDATCCITKLETLGRYEYNFLTVRTYEMRLSKWLDAQEFLAFLPEVTWGDVYVKLCK